MKKLYSILFLFILFNSYVIAQDNPFDLSEEKALIDELGFPTKSSVDESKKIAYEFFNNEDWENAANALNKYSKLANYMANIIRSGIEPYYSASYDDRKNFSRTRITVLAKYETLSNNYILDRNIAMVDEAICYIKLNDYNNALPLLIKALDLINIDNTDLWDKAMQNLYFLIKIE